MSEGSMARGMQFLGSVWMDGQSRPSLFKVCVCQSDLYRFQLYHGAYQYKEQVRTGRFDLKVSATTVVRDCPSMLCRFSHKHPRDGRAVQMVPYKNQWRFDTTGTIPAN